MQTDGRGGRRYLTPARFRNDPGWGLTSALRCATRRRDSHQGGDLRALVATPERRFAGAESPVEALAASLAAGRGVDAAFIADLLACEPDAVVAELAASGLIFSGP